MNSHDLKIWLTVNSYTQKQLATALGVSLGTVNNWATKKPPTWLKLALAGLENK